MTPPGPSVSKWGWCSLLRHLLHSPYRSSLPCFTTASVFKLDPGFCFYSLTTAMLVYRLCINPPTRHVMAKPTRGFCTESSYSPLRGRGKKPRQLQMPTMKMFSGNIPSSRNYPAEGTFDSQTTRGFFEYREGNCAEAKVVLSAQK